MGKVVQDFKRALPDAEIYVFDNNCTDQTARVAQAAGAIVYREKRQGKGHVVAAMFEQVDADIYVMVDGDDTYDASSVNLLLEPIFKGDADITVAGRLHQFGDKSFRNFHILGNRLVCHIINRMFDSNISDIFSGYRAFTREAARLFFQIANRFRRRAGVAETVPDDPLVQAAYFFRRLEHRGAGAGDAGGNPAFG